MFGDITYRMDLWVNGNHRWKDTRVKYSSTSFSWSFSWDCDEPGVWTFYVNAKNNRGQGRFYDNDSTVAI